MRRKLSSTLALIFVFAGVFAGVSAGPSGALASDLHSASTPGSALECLEFDIQAHLGHVANSRDVKALEFYDPDSRYFELGVGEGGGSVYRVHPPHNKPTYVLKQYRDPRKREDDAITYSFLKHLPPPPDGIEIVYPEVIGKKSMRFPDIEGQTLKSVMLAPGLSQAERKLLLDRWNQFLEQTSAEVMKEAGIHDDGLGQYYGLRSYFVKFKHNGKTVGIWLKADNVIVQPKTGRMYVIDPY